MRHKSFPKCTILLYYKYYGTKYYSIDVFTTRNWDSCKLPSADAETVLKII